MKKYILIAIAVIAIAAGTAYATSWYASDVTLAADGQASSPAWDVSGATAAQDIVLNCQSTIVTLKANRGPNTAITNLTTITVTARATHNYTTRSKYRNIWARYSTVYKVAHHQYMEGVSW